jgi:TPR repeat protein
VSTEDDNKTGLVPSPSSALSRSGVMSLIRRGLQDLIAIREAAQYCDLGHDYYSGHGVPQDDKQAAFWFRKAAEGGDADGQFMLAAMYLEGEGVSHDAEEAILWFRKSADQDDVGAQIVLGSIHEVGEIVPQDYAQAAY